MPERFWNRLGTENRQKLLVQEGFSSEHEPWKRLSIAERTWLFSPLLLMEMTSLETVTSKIQHADFNKLESRRAE